MLLTVGILGLIVPVGVAGLYAVALRQAGWLQDDRPG